MNSHPNPCRICGMYYCFHLPNYGFYSSNTPCDHCYCQNSVIKIDHKRCCKCGDDRHQKFIDEKKV